MTKEEEDPPRSVDAPHTAYLLQTMSVEKNPVMDRNFKLDGKIAHFDMFMWKKIENQILSLDKMTNVRYVDSPHTLTIFTSTLSTRWWGYHCFLLKTLINIHRQLLGTFS